MPPLNVRTPALPAMAIEAEGMRALPPATEDDDLIGYEAALPFLRQDAMLDAEGAVA